MFWRGKEMPKESAPAGLPVTGDSDYQRLAEEEIHHYSEIFLGKDSDPSARETLFQPVPPSITSAPGPGSLKSCRRTLRPSGASTAVTRTSGFPAFAITKASPLAALSTRRERCVFAF